MIAEERRKGPNPVIPRIHRMRQNPTSPRPFDSAEVARIWSLLEKHGSTQAKLAVSIGLECGLRPGEIARLKFQDIDMKKQQLYVGLPTKNGQSRTVFFSVQTNKYLQQWLKERDPECGHDRLLYGFRKLPFTRGRLHNEIAMAVCKEYRGRDRIADGFEKWSTHRLRHTFATTMANNGASAASLMALGGWRSSKAMAGYTKLDPDAVRRSYAEAMRRSREKCTSTTRSLSFSQYIESRAPQS